MAEENVFIKKVNDILIYYVITLLLHYFALFGQNIYQMNLQA